jgi:hypothetical protein
MMPGGCLWKWPWPPRRALVRCRRQLGTTASPDLETGMNSNAMARSRRISARKTCGRGYSTGHNSTSISQPSGMAGVGGQGNSPNVDIHKSTSNIKALWDVLKQDHRHRPMASRCKTPISWNIQLFLVTVTVTVSVQKHLQSHRHAN